MAEVISVSALNRYVKNLLDVNDVLFDLALRGEIANFVQNARSGHCYFSLRDEAASVRAVMFRSDARRLGFQPEEGMKDCLHRSIKNRCPGSRSVSALSPARPVLHCRIFAMSSVGAGPQCVCCWLL